MTAPLTDRNGFPIAITIRYRRPEAPWSVVKTVVPDANAAKIQIDRLTALGYAILDVSPPTGAGS